VKLKYTIVSLVQTINIFFSFSLFYLNEIRVTSPFEYETEFDRCHNMG